MNVLFICSKNKWRSRTAETIFKDSQDHDVRSAGTENDARIKVTEKLIIWSDLIFVMEKHHKEKLRERSATYFAEKICKTTPILIFQGTADWRVPADQVFVLVQKFYQVKQPFRFILYEGGQHSLIEHRPHYYFQLINWFNYYLRDGKRWPDLNPHGN